MSLQPQEPAEAWDVAIEWAITLLLVAGIGVTDAMTGARLGLSIFYVFPIGLLGYRRGWMPAVALVGATTATSAAVDWYVLSSDGPAIEGWRLFLRLVAYGAAVGLPGAVRSVYERVLSLSRVDELTGVLNRRAFDDACVTELRRCQRLALPLSIAMLDLDGFKAVNDRLGHSAGDAMLRTLGRVLKSLRRGDIPGRIGGDEFAILLPGSDAAVAARALGRIVSAVEAELRTHQVEVTCSVGLATYEGSFPAPAALLKDADAAMFSAKRAGKARIHTSMFLPS